MSKAPPQQQQQQLALQTMPSAQVQRGMPEGQLTATMAAFKGLVQISDDKKLSEQQPTVHVLKALPAPARRTFCELELYASP